MQAQLLQANAEWMERSARSTDATYLLVLIETRPLLRNFLPFLNHSTQGCGEPVTLHFKRSLVFACTR